MDERIEEIRRRVAAQGSPQLDDLRYLLDWADRAVVVIDDIGRDNHLLATENDRLRDVIRDQK